VGVDLDHARAFVARNSQAVLTTLRQDGTPQLSPVLVALEDEGTLAISSRETAYKTKNLRRHPRAWLCVLSPGFYGEWIQVEGTVEVQSLPEAMEPLVAYYRKLSGEHDDWDDYRAAMQREERCVLRVTLTKAGPDRQG
jgi:PPOX class probable F420-dependent enzyme